VIREKIGPVTIDLDEFRSFTHRRIWEDQERMEIRQLKSGITVQEKNRRRFEDITKLYEEVSSLSYFPKVPFLNFTVRKGFGNLRFTPVFRWQDRYVYRYCTGMLADVMVSGRVADTFGGFLSAKEFLNAENENLEDFEESEYGSSIGSFNRQAWLNE
jgi:hypothetical protein